MLFDRNGEEDVCVHIRRYIYCNDATKHVAWASVANQSKYFLVIASLIYFLFWALTSVMFFSFCVTYYGHKTVLFFVYRC